MKPRWLILPSLGAGGLTAASVVRIAVQLIIYPIIGRHIGPEGVGQIALVAPFIGLAMMFGEAGLGTALIRAGTLTRELVGTVFVFSITVSGAIFAILVVCAEPLAQFFHAPQFAGLLIGMSASLILASINVVPTSLLLRDNRYGAVACSDLLSTLLGLAGVILGVALGWGVYSLVFQQIVSWFSRALFGTVAARWRPSLAFRRHLLSEHLGLGVHLTGASLFSFVGKNIDSLLLAWMFGEQSLGFYAMAFQFVTLPQMATSGSTYMTALGRVSEAERLQQSSTHIYLAALRCTLLVCAPMVAGIALVSPLAIPLILGANWQPAVLLAILLAPYGFCETLWPSLSGVIRGHGRGGVILGLGLCNGAITTLAIIGAARFGSVAVAAAVSASALIGLILGLGALNRIYGLSFARVARLFVPAGTATLIMVGVVLVVLPPVPTSTPPIIRLALEIMLGAATYLCALAPFRRHYQTEIDALKRALWRPARAVPPTPLPKAIKLPPAVGPRPTAPAVIVVTRNRAEVLARTVDHLRRQTLAPALIIVSCSSEADAGIVATWPDVTVVYGVSGLTCQRNRALRAVPDGMDVVVFFDDDFVPHEEWLAATIDAFGAHPDVAVITGDLVADGGKGPGVAFDAAVALLRDVDTSLKTWVRDDRPPYGCNMAFRTALVRAVGFDERLTSYGWLEDADIGGALRNRGWRMIQIGAATGVHMGVKVGRTPGELLGYSQVMNPLYLYRKGTLRLPGALKVLTRNVASNLARSLWPEPYVDRRGRIRGNLRALRLLLLGRLRPEHHAVEDWPGNAGAASRQVN